MDIKGVVLAGGTGSRLFPLTKVTNKHLLPVGRKPMICHAIDKLVGAGLSDIMVVTGVEHMGDVVGLLGSGAEYGCDLTYRVQDRAGGIAEALGLAKGFVRERCCVILGDNIFEASLRPTVDRYRAQPEGARVLLKEVEDPHRFGVATMQGGKVTKIVEKPKDPESSFAVTGIYFYDLALFDIIASIERSARGELEITDVNNAYLARGQLSYDILEGYWSDAGTFDSWRRANELAFG